MNLSDEFGSDTMEFPLRVATPAKCTELSPLIP